MNYQSLNLVAIILLGICAVLLVISVLLFIRFRIFSIIGDLSGRTARKQIERSRNDNEKSGYKIHKPNAFNVERGTITEVVSAKGKSGRIGKTGKTSNTSNISSNVAATHPSKRLGKNDSQNKVNEVVYQDKPTDVLADNQSTEILSNATEVLLDENATTILSTNETEVLSDDNGTTILNQTEKLNKDNFDAVEFNIVKSIISTHSSEVI